MDLRPAAVVVDEHLAVAQLVEPIAKVIRDIRRHEFELGWCECRSLQQPLPLSPSVSGCATIDSHSEANILNHVGTRAVWGYRR